MSLQDLIVTKTNDEMLAEELTVAQSEGLATTTWQAGSVIRTILVIMAHMFAMFSAIIVAPIRGGFGDLVSTLGWAKIWAKQTFDVDHVGAEPATGYVDITNATDEQHDLDVGELIIAHQTTGKLYRNDAAISILANDTLEDVAISASEVGTGSNAAPGTITVVVGPSMDGVTVTNPASVLGADDETVSALVDRSRGKLAALSPDGPKEAYNYIAKTPEFSPTSTPITRATTKADPATGLVTTYIANAGGAPSSGDVAIVQAAFDKWAEPWCVTSTATAAAPVTVHVTYQVWVRSSLAEADIKTAIATTLATYFAALDIGGDIIPPAVTGTVYVDALAVSISGAKTAADQAIGAVRCLVTLPAADVDLDEDEVAVLGTVTGTVNFL